MRGGAVIAAAAAVGCAAIALGALGLMSINSGFGWGEPPLGFGLTQGYDTAAMRWLQAGGSPADLAAAAALDEKALRLAPYAGVPRLRLAHIDSLRNHGALSPRGAAQFSLTYELTPADPKIAAWRIRFGLEHWGYISSEARQNVLAEAKSFNGLGSRLVDVPAILSSVQDSRGRLAAALWTSSEALRRAPAPTNSATN